MRAHIGALQAAVLGLLALLLGFTFAMTGARYVREPQKALIDLRTSLDRPTP